MRKHLTPGRLALAAILLGGLAVRLYGLQHGLPFIFHIDEAQNFTRYAVRMFDDGFNPHYFNNPTTFTYLVHIALRLRGFDDVVAQHAADPSEIYETARLVAVLLALLGVGAVYAVGRRLWDTFEGLVAAAVLAFAVLPVAYSRFALTDVGVLPAVAIAVYGLVRIHEAGGRRNYVIAGLGFGLVVAFKYMAGLVLAPVLVAVLLRARREDRPLRELAKGTAIVVGTGALVFFITNPFFVLDLGDALDQLSDQREAANEPRFGQDEESPLGFYLSTLTWGLGWGALVAAVVGAVWQFRRDRVRAALLLFFPVLLVLYMATDAELFFARWLLPAYPVLALLAGVGVAGVARSLSRRPVVRAAAVAGLTTAALAQPLVVNLHTADVIEKADTRELARNYMLDNLEPGTRIVVDAVAIRPRYDLPLLGLPQNPDDPHFISGFSAPPKADDPDRKVRTHRFIEDLDPARIDRYRADGYCVVITMSWLRERAAISGVDEAVAYYDRLERESTELFRADPYEDPDDPEPFDFDQTQLYWSDRYERAGPVVSIRRLDRCRNGVKRTA